MASDLLKEGSQERGKQERDEGNPSKAAISGEVSASSLILLGALECKLHHRSYRELVNYPVELAQPKGQGVSFLLLSQSVISKGGVEGRERRVLNSQPLPAVRVCVCVCVCVCVHACVCPGLG